MLRLICRRGLIEAYENRPIGRMIYKGLRNELKMAFNVMRPLPANRFIIFAQGRTGSTLLTSTLDSHPEITCLDEILGSPRALPIPFIANAARASRDKCFGFHVKIYQLTSWQRVGDVHNWLETANLRGWKILYLRRENLLRQVMSNVFAEAAGTYHHLSGVASKRPDSIILPVERLRRGIKGRRLHIAAEQIALKGLDYLELVYERDLENSELQADTFDRIQAYLGLNRTHLTPSLNKAVVTPIDQLITNYAEVRDALSGTPDEVFLDA